MISYVSRTARSVRDFVRGYPCTIACGVVSVAAGGVTGLSIVGGYGEATTATAALATVIYIPLTAMMYTAEETRDNNDQLR